MKNFEIFTDCVHHVGVHTVIFWEFSPTIFLVFQGVENFEGGQKKIMGGYKAEFFFQNLLIPSGITYNFPKVPKGGGTWSKKNKVWKKTRISRTTACFLNTVPRRHREKTRSKTLIFFRTLLKYHKCIQHFFWWIFSRVAWWTKEVYLQEFSTPLPSYLPLKIAFFN